MGLLGCVGGVVVIGDEVSGEVLAAIQPEALSTVDRPPAAPAALYYPRYVEQDPVHPADDRGERYSQMISTTQPGRRWR